MLSFLLPVVSIAIIAVGISHLSGRFSPSRSAVVALLTLILGSLAALPVLVHLSISWLIGVPEVGPALHTRLHGGGVHLEQQTWLGAVVSVLTMVTIVRIVVMVVAHRRLARANVGGIQLVPDREMYAYALPGKNAGIVVSEGLVQSLSEDELDVVLAHEQAHVQHRHDIWILIGRLCVAINPFLRWSFTALRHSLERTADAAAVEIFRDRGLVARTIAKVALGPKQPRTVLAVASFGVAARVRGLVAPSLRTSTLHSVVSSLGLAGVATLCAVQWHHVAVSVATVCGV